jgi:hypothetical protein
MHVQEFQFSATHFNLGNKLFWLQKHGKKSRADLFFPDFGALAPAADHRQLWRNLAPAAATLFLGSPSLGLPASPRPAILYPGGVGEERRLARQNPNVEEEEE